MKKVCFVLLLLACFTLTEVFATNQIKDVKHFLSKERETITLTFDSNYSGLPSLITTENGWIRIRIPNAKISNKFANLRINDRFLEKIQFQNQKSQVNLDLYFADKNFNLTDHLEMPSEKNKLTIFIRRGAPLSSNSVEEPPSAHPASVSKSDKLPPNEEDLSGLVLQVLLFLIVFISLLLLLLWVYKKYFSKKFLFKKGKYEIKVAATHFLSQKQKVIVLEVNGNAYACGVSNNQINLISEVPKKNAIYFQNIIDQSGTTLGKLKAEYLDTLKKRHFWKIRLKKKRV